MAVKSLIYARWVNSFIGKADPTLLSTIKSPLVVNVCKGGGMSAAYVRRVIIDHSGFIKVR